MHSSAVLSAYLQHGPALRRFVSRIVRGSIVDDILQETFIRAYTVELGRPIEQPKSFLFRIAKHEALDYLAHTNRWLSGISEEDLREGYVSCEDVLAAEQTIERRLQAVNELPTVCRQVYCLRRFDGLSQQQTSAVLGIALSTVEKHMIKASARVEAA